MAIKKFSKAKDYIEIKELAAACRKKRILNHDDYLKHYKDIKGAPSNLRRSYPEYEGYNLFLRLGAEKESPDTLRELGIFHLK